MPLTEYRVWDRTQRVFHWVNFVAVLTLAAIGTVILNADRLGIPDDPGMIALKTTHVYVGYIFILNLLWRLLWGFVGGPYARWRALLPWGPQFARACAPSPPASLPDARPSISAIIRLRAFFSRCCSYC